MWFWVLFAVAVAADADGDGFAVGDGDCDDSDAGVSPGEPEICNGVDDDCSGEVDDGGACACPTVASGDAIYQLCAGSSSWSAADSACTADDYHLVVIGDAVENTFVTASATAEGLTPWWIGYTDLATEDAFAWVDGSAGAYTNWGPGEPDDASPGQDCGSMVGTGLWYDEKCNDRTDWVCEAECAGAWYEDTDGDGFGDPSTMTEGCSAPLGDWVGVGDDCDDGDRDVNPDAEEVCDGVDQDCDGEVDEAPAGTTIWYRDADGDGHGDEGTTTTGCDQPDGYVSSFDDCDDADGANFPGGTEVCDAADNDCDGDVDEDVADPTQWYPDADGDGYGTGTAIEGCDSPGSGYADAGGDCDDADADVSPGDAEIEGNGIDDDCDGEIDEEPDPVDTDTDVDPGDTDVTDTDGNPLAPGGWSGGGGCGTAGGAASLLFLAVLPLVRRRSS